MDVEKKIVEMQKYIPCLRLLIESLQRDPLKAHQVKKMKMLMDMLTKHDTSKSIKLETLIKCEAILMKVYGKGKEPPPMNTASEEHLRHKEDKLRRERKREQKERRRMERREQELKYLNRLAKKRRKNLEENNPDKGKIVNGNSASCNTAPLILKIKQEKMDYDENIKRQEADVKKEEQNVQSAAKDPKEKTEAEKIMTKLSDVDNIKLDINSDEKSDTIKATEENKLAVVKEDVNLKEEPGDDKMSQSGTDDSKAKTEPVKEAIKDVKTEAEKSTAEKSEAEKPEVSACINTKPNNYVDKEIEKSSSKVTDTNKDTETVKQPAEQPEAEKPKEKASSKFKEEIEKSEESAESSKSGFVDLTSDDSCDGTSSVEKNSLKRTSIGNESNSKQIESIKLPQINSNDKPATAYPIKNKTDSSTSGNLDEYDGPPYIMTIDLLDSDSDDEDKCKSLKCDTPTMKMPTPKIISRPIDRFNDRPMFTISSVQSMNANQPESEERREVERTVSAIVKSIQYTCHHTVPYKYNGLVRTYLEKFVRDLMIEKNRVNLCLQKLQKSVSPDKFKEIKKIIQTYCSEPVSDPNIPSPSPFSHRIKVYPEKLQDVMRQLFFTNNVITVIGYKVYSLVNSPVSYLNGLTQSKTIEMKKTLVSTGIQSQIIKKSPSLIGLTNSSKSNPSFTTFNANTDLLSPLKSEMISSAEKQKICSGSGSNSKNRRRKRSDDDDDESYVPHGCKDSGSDDSAQATAEPVRRVSLQRASKLRCQRYLALEKAMENDEFILRHENAFRNTKSTDSIKTSQKAKLPTAPKTPQMKTPDNSKTPQISNSTQKRPCSYSSTRSKRARRGDLMSPVMHEDEPIEVPEQDEAEDEQDQSNDQMQPDNEDSTVDREVEDEEDDECEQPPEIDTSKVNDGKNIVRAYHCRSKYLEKCLICHEKVTRKSSAVPHYVNVHRDREVMVSRLTKTDITQLLTQTINFAFLSSSKSSQNTYMATCIFCKRQMTCSLRFWLEHYTSHTGEFGYQCSNCTIRRSVKQQAKRHVNFECKTRSPKIIMIFELEKSANEINAYVCLLCNYIQLQHENLLNHLQTEHELAQGHITDAHYRMVNLLSVIRPYFDEFNQTIDNYGNVVNHDSLEYFNTQRFVDAHFNEQKAFIDGDDMSFMICNMLATDEDHQLNIPDGADTAEMTKKDGEKITSIETVSEEVQVTPDELTTVPVDVEISEFTDNADPIIVENSDISTGSHNEEAIVLERAESEKFSKDTKAVEDEAIENKNKTEISEALEANEEKTNQLANKVEADTKTLETVKSAETAESTLESKNNDKPTAAVATETLESANNVDSTPERAATPSDSGAVITDTSLSAPIPEIVEIPTTAVQSNNETTGAATADTLKSSLESKNNDKPIAALATETLESADSTTNRAATLIDSGKSTGAVNTDTTSESAPIPDLVSIPTMPIQSNNDEATAAESAEAAKCFDDVKPVQKIDNVTTDYLKSIDTKATTVAEAAGACEFKNTTPSVLNEESTAVEPTFFAEQGKSLEVKPTETKAATDTLGAVLTDKERTIYPDLSNNRAATASGDKDSSEAVDSAKASLKATDNAEIEAKISIELNNEEAIASKPPVEELEFSDVAKSVEEGAKVSSAETGVSESTQNDKEATESPKSDANEATITTEAGKNSGISEGPQNDKEATESLESAANKATITTEAGKNSGISEGPQNDKEATKSQKLDTSEAPETDRETTHCSRSNCDEAIAVADHVENSETEDNAADGPSSIAVEATKVTGPTEKLETADNAIDCPESINAETTIIGGFAGFPENSEAESNEESTTERVTPSIASDKSCNGEVSGPEPSESMHVGTTKATTPEISGPLASDVERNNIEG